MDKKHTPVRLEDLAEEIASPSKPASAWMDEFLKARRDGQLVILKLNGKRRGNNYSTRHHVEQYLRRAYRAEAV